MHVWKMETILTEIKEGYFNKHLLKKINSFTKEIIIKRYDRTVEDKLGDIKNNVQAQCP